MTTYETTSTVPAYEVPLTSGSILMSIVGVLANSLTLSYYIKRQDKGLGNRLLILLNSSDLIVCLIFIPRALLEHICVYGNGSYGAYASYFVSDFIFITSFDCTGFSTCLISVTRTIKVCRPFFSIKGVWTAVSFLLYFLCILTRESLYSYASNVQYGHVKYEKYIKRYYPLIFSLGTTLIVIAVFISMVITTYWLSKRSKVQGNISANNRRATVTILILSTVFCLLNGIFITACLLDLCIRFGLIKGGTVVSLIQSYTYEIAWKVVICLNSTVNPIIYLARKEEMRQHVNEMWGALKDKFTTRPRDDIPQGGRPQGGRPQRFDIELTAISLVAH